MDDGDDDFVDDDGEGKGKAKAKGKEKHKGKCKVIKKHTGEAKGKGKDNRESTDTAEGTLMAAAKVCHIYRIFIVTYISRST
jgi:hypothetical protein